MTSNNHERRLFEPDKEQTAAADSPSPLPEIARAASLIYPLCGEVEWIRRSPSKCSPLRKWWLRWAYGVL